MRNENDADCNDKFRPSHADSPPPPVPFRVMRNTQAQFSLGNVDIASNLFGVVASIDETEQIVPPLLKRVFAAKRK